MGPIATYRAEFKSLAPKVWEHFSLCDEGKKAAKYCFEVEKATALRCYRAILNSIKKPETT